MKTKRDRVQKKWAVVVEIQQSVLNQRPLVFLIEDEAALLEAWVDSLNQMGFRAQGFSTAAAFYRAFAVSRCHAVVVDVELPDEDGFSIVRHIRAVENIGIILATGRGRLEDRVEGLRAGGDAFLVKPVHTEELVATLEAVLRRVGFAQEKSPVQEQPLSPAVPSIEKPVHWSLSDGNWVLIDPAGQTLRLTTSERSILTMLFARKNEPVDREQLATTLDRGDKEEGGSQRVDTVISRLRRKALAAGMQLPLYSARGRGYEFHG